MSFPYIGITDFLSFAQVSRMLAVIKRHRRPGSKRQLHVGVMMSYKTLHGIETQWSKAFPPKETIAGVFASGDAYNCLHYADYGIDPDFENSLACALSYGGSGMNAVQLDMIWPNPHEIARGVAASGRQIEVILQVGKNAIAEADNNPETVAERLEAYQGIVHRVLLDKSMGRGVGMDAEGLLPFARAIRKRFPEIGLGAAGGLGPRTVNLAEPLVAEFPDVSIDAQGKLRPSGSALDPVDWDMAEEYLVRALELLK